MVDFERIEQLIGVFQLAEQQFELSGVEPDTAAVGAVVDFNFLKLKGNHRVFANRTIHNVSPQNKRLTAEDAEKNQKLKIKEQNGK